MNPHLSEGQLNAYLKFAIGVTFCLILVIMSGLSMYSVVFVIQPMSGMAPADKQFFLLLSDMSKYILGALATLIAVKGTDQFVPPGLTTTKEREDACKPTPIPAPIVRAEPKLDPITPAGDTYVGFGGKLAPVQPPHPEIE
jgi:hypothetical protein